MNRTIVSFILALPLLSILGLRVACADQRAMLSAADRQALSAALDKAADAVNASSKANLDSQKRVVELQKQIEAENKRVDDAYDVAIKASHAADELIAAMADKYGFDADYDGVDPVTGAIHRNPTPLGKAVKRAPARLSTSLSGSIWGCVLRADGTCAR